MAVREGKWDCEYCGAVNPGSAMKCTACGAVRGENVRFYLDVDAPEVTDQEKLAEARGGTDWHCRYCGTDNRRRQDKCRQCGAPREGMAGREESFIPAEGSGGGSGEGSPEHGAAGAGIRADGGPKSAEKGEKGRKGKLSRKAGRILFLALLAAGAAFIFLVARGTEAELVVERGEWTRTIGVEEQEWIRYEQWEDDVPRGARILRSWEAQRGTEKIQVGTERVKTGTKDLGNGYFEDVYEEKPVYEDKPVYDTRVEYEIQEWVETRSLTVTGNLSIDPEWPEVFLKFGEREGTRRESARLFFSGTDPDDRDKVFTYDKLSPEDLGEYRQGQRISAMVSGSRVKKLLNEGNSKNQ